MGRFGQRIEAVTFCPSAIVLNQDATSRYKDGEKLYHPARSDEKNVQESVRVEKQLAFTVGPLTQTRLHSICAKLRQGQPPQRNDEETRRFVTGTSTVQRQPSFALTTHYLSRQEKPDGKTLYKCVHAIVDFKRHCTDDRALSCDRVCTRFQNLL